jgi:hypothetical protein
MQEGLALRQAKERGDSRQGRQHAQMMHLKMTAANLQSLAQSVGHEHYVTTPEDLAQMKRFIKEGAVKEMGEMALALFYQLREPGAPEPGAEEEEAKALSVLQGIKEIFGIEDKPDAEPASDAVPAPGRETGRKASHPEITDEEWEAREPARQLLENILTRQVEVYEERRKAILRERLEGPLSCERAAEAAPTQPNTALAMMEPSAFRQVSRISSLLLRFKRHQARELETPEKEAA